MNTMIQLSIVVPLYNEEQNVRLLVERIQQALSNQSYEIILIDDGSTDDTKTEILKLISESISLIELRRNYGQSRAIAAGFDLAKGKYIVTMDGDLQNDPDDILMMLGKLQSGDFDLVTGIRQKRKDDLVRTFSSKIANWIIRKTTGLDIKDHGCALKVFTRETAKGLNLYGEMHRYISLLAFFDGAKIAQVPVKHHARQYGMSKYGLGRTSKVINDLILILFQQKYLQRPIHIFGNIGLVSFLIGICISIWLLIVKYGYGQDIGNRPLLIVGFLFLIVGVQFFVGGLVMDLMMRTYYESQNKQPFKVRSVYTFRSEPKLK